MKQTVMLSLRGQQDYIDQEPEVIDLITEGTLEYTPDGWRISYQESELTGLQGVTTTFLINNDCITLTRTGRLNSQMVFRQGEVHDSLYEMEFGALMISVCASQIRWDISYAGGVVDLVYNIEIDRTSAGLVTYHLDIAPKT